MIRKTRVKHVRLTEEEAQKFEYYANRMGETESRLLRKFIREAINQQPDFLLDEQSFLMVAVRQLVGIANNLNQITRAIHRGKTDLSLDREYLEKLKNYVCLVQQALVQHIQRARQRWVSPV